MNDRLDVESAIPHRAPFLFVDRVVARFKDGLSAEWRVPVDADFFRGHYPLEPVLPGVILCEHVFQCAAVFVSERIGGFAAQDGIPVLARIEQARFRRIVRPGETIETRVELLECIGPAHVFQGQSAVAGERALRLGFVLAGTGALERAFGGGT